MSDVDPTPETPVTIGDRLAWWRADLNARLTALSLQLATQHTALITRLDTLAGGVTLAQLRTAIEAGAGTSAADLVTIASAVTAMNGHVTSIQVVLGDLLTTEPTGYTIKELLALIKGDIGGVITTGNADIGVCPGSWAYFSRVLSWSLVGQGASINGSDYDIYAPDVITGGPFISQGEFSFVAIGNSAFFDANPIGGIDTCGSWNFTGRADTPSVIAVLGNDALGAWPDGIDPAMSAAISGGIAHTLEGPLEIMGYRVAVPYNAPAPELNFWWHNSGWSGMS